jgi:hypothetical protein
MNDNTNMFECFLVGCTILDIGYWMLDTGCLILDA